MAATLDHGVVDPQQIITELQRQLGEVIAERDGAIAERDGVVAERDAALARETATAEVLKIVSSSAGNLAPVFDAILEKAMRLCDAVHGHIWTYDGELAHPAAVCGETRFVDYIRQLGPVRPGPSSP